MSNYKNGKFDYVKASKKRCAKMIDSKAYRDMKSEQRELRNIRAFWNKGEL